MPTRLTLHLHVPAQPWPALPTRALLAIMALVVALSGLPIATGVPAQAAAQESGGEEVIVVLEDGADPVAAARDMGVAVKHIYRHVFTGFAGTLPPQTDTLEIARSRRIVATISPDEPVQAEAQVVPTGVRRSGVPVDPSGDSLAIDSPVDADIAVLDTGIADLPDLNVEGGFSCVGPDENDWEDDNDHGTHTAGIAAAIDNGTGVVGVAPGARLWAVKVLDQDGFGTVSDVICGLDWVVEHGDTIDVINLSLSGAAGKSKHRNCSSSALHQAVCSVVNAGISVVVAAGNQSSNAKTRVPAAFDEVITVSGFADSDGEPGSNGPKPCVGSKDDVFMPFSNFGAAVDIAAPGACILSYLSNGNTFRLSGTSEASPHVAGAAAVFVADFEAENGLQPTPSQVRSWLLNDASRTQGEDGVSGDPDAKKNKKKKGKKGKGKHKKNKNKKKRKRKHRVKAGHREPVIWLEVLADS